MFSLPIDPEDLALIQSYGKEHKIPVIAIHSAGFYSYFRINLPGNFPIVDTHPDSTATTDLRLLSPWPELSVFAADLTKNIESLPDREHGHVPYVVLLLHYLEKWKELHGSPPVSYKDKKAFKEYVSAGARIDNAEGGEENFDEAASAVLKTVSAPSLASPVQAVFDYKPNDVCENTSLMFKQLTYIAHQYQVESESSFWIIADAIKQFYAKHKELPLPGSVPDMKALSNIYVQLQNIYKAKARQDVAEVLETVRAHPAGKDIDVAEVETFCKNAAFIKLIHGVELSPANIQTIASMLLIHYHWR